MINECFLLGVSSPFFATRTECLQAAKKDGEISKCFMQSIFPDIALFFIIPVAVKIYKESCRVSSPLLGIDNLLHHDLLAVYDVNALRGILHLTALDVVDATSILLLSIDEDNTVRNIVLE